MILFVPGWLSQVALNYPVVSVLLRVLDAATLNLYVSPLEFILDTDSLNSEY